MTLVAFLKSKAALVVTYGGASGGSGSEPQGPSAQTDPATSVTNATAVLNGVINGQGLDCQVQFEYGPTTNYGKITPLQTFPASSMNQNVSAALKGLAPDTTYHFRIRAATEIGQTYGLDATFETYPIAGINPTVVGSVPEVATTGVSNLDVDVGTGLAAARLNATVDAGTHAHATAATIGIRRVGAGTGYAWYNQQAVATSSITPVAFYADTGYTLQADTDYEYIVDATNIKGNVQSAPPQQFHTPPAPPPPGVPPTVNTGAASLVTSSTALIETTVNHSNAASGTGHTDVWLRYRKTTAPANATDYQFQVGPINLAPLTGNVATSFSQAINGLSALSDYFVWTFASNPYGTADDWATPTAFTTAAVTTLGTIDVFKDDNWVAYGQATVFCSYTTPAAGTFTVRFGYRVNGSGAAFTYTAYESVAVSLTAATWDAVIGGLTPNTSYEVIAQLYDTANTVQSTGSAFVTTLGAPAATKGGYTSNMPGKGPGSRGTPSAASGQTPTISDIATYADPRRPSSGLISETNPRLFKPNIAADPTYGPAMLAHYNGLGLLNNPEGYDIFVYGSGHAIGGYTTYDIEIWDPKLCDAIQAGATPPLVVANADHAKSSKALHHAIKAFARHSDVVGGIGTFDSLKLCGGSTTTVGSNSEACWVTATGIRKTIVGVSVYGGVALGAANQLRINDSISFGSRIGALTNVHFKNVYGRGASGGNQFFSYVENGGSNIAGAWVFNGLIGLHGAYACKVETDASGGQQSGFGLQHCLRSFCASTRHDFRDNEFQWCREHQFYVDNPSPPQAGTEGGVAAPSFYLRNTGIAGLSLAKTGCSKTWYQQVARMQDKQPDSNCTNCGGGCSPCNHSIGPNGEGDIYVIDNESFGEVGTTHDVSVTGHHGRVILKIVNARAALLMGANAGCCDGLRPVNGNDGYVYATKELVIRDWHTALLTLAQNVAIKLDGVMRVEIQDISIPAAFNRYLVCVATGAFSNVKYNGVSINCCGFVKATMNNPLSAWGGWNGGAYSTGEFRFAYLDGGAQSMNDTTTLPILSGHAYTITEVDAFYNGVCRLDFPAPPAGGSVGCLNDPA